MREAGDLKGVPPVEALQAFSAAFARVLKDDVAIAEGPLATKVSGHPVRLSMKSTFGCGAGMEDDSRAMAGAARGRALPR
jgi:hypothetical protein